MPRGKSMILLSRGAGLRSGFRFTIREHYIVSLGLSLFFAWTWLVFQTSLFAPGGIDIVGLSGSYASIPYVPMLFFGGGFAVIGITFACWGAVPHGNRYTAFIPGMICLGELLFIVIASGIVPEGIGSVVYLIASALTGFGAAYLYLEWGRLLSSFGSRETLFFVVTGTLGAAIICAALSLLLDIGLMYAALVLPVPIMLLLHFASKTADVQWTHGIHNERRIPWKLVFTAAVQGIGFGLEQALVLAGADILQPFFVTSVGFALAAFLVILVAILYKFDYNQLIYQVGYIIVATGFLFLGINRLSGSALMVQSVGYRFVDLMMWSLCAFLVKQRGFSTNWVFSFTSVLIFARCAGTTIGASAIDMQLPGAETEIVIALGGVFVTLASATLLSNSNNIVTGWGIERPSLHSSDLGKSGFDLACDNIAKRYQLTSREKEIFTYLAKGRNASYICDALVIAKETVKTHCNNIYRKLDVHSLQELIDIIDDEMSMLGTYDDDKPIPTPHAQAGRGKG